MDGLEDSIPSPIEEEPPARPPPVKSRASREAPRSAATVPGPLASAARVAAAPALVPALATPPATLSAPATAPRAARAAAAAPGRAAIALAPPPPPATPAWESDFSATPATSQVSSSGWATFGQFEDGNAASLSVAEAADFALPLEASEPSAVSSDAEGLLGAFQSLGPTPATPPETPLSPAGGWVRVGEACVRSSVGIGGVGPRDHRLCGLILKYKTSAMQTAYSPHKRCPSPFRSHRPADRDAAAQPVARDGRSQGCAAGAAAGPV